MPCYRVSEERKIREVGTGYGEGDEGVYPRTMQGSGSAAIVPSCSHVCGEISRSTSSEIDPVEDCVRVYRTIPWLPGTQWLVKTPADILLGGVMWISMWEARAGRWNLPWKARVCHVRPRCMNTRHEINAVQSYDLFPTTSH